MTGLIETTAKLNPATITVSAAFVIGWYGLMAVIIVLLNRPQKGRPTWYNKKQEEPQDVRTLKVA
jgi:hypothetical protein